MFLIFSDSGLQLYVGRDGSAMLGGDNRLSSGLFERVVFVDK